MKRPGTFPIDANDENIRNLGLTCIRIYRLSTCRSKQFAKQAFRLATWGAHCLEAEIFSAEVAINCRYTVQLHNTSIEIAAIHYGFQRGA